MEANNNSVNSLEVDHEANGTVASHLEVAQGAVCSSEVSTSLETGHQTCHESIRSVAANDSWAHNLKSGHEAECSLEASISLKAGHSVMRNLEAV